MKALHIIFIISLMSVSETFSKQTNSIYPQFWHNTYLNRTIEVYRYNDGIEVKGLHSDRGYTWFQRRSSTSYYDRYGNKLKLIRDKVIYYGNRRNSRLTFLPLHNRSQNWNCDDNSNHRDMDYFDEDYGQNRDYHHLNRTYKEYERPSKEYRSREQETNEKDTNKLNQNYTQSTDNEDIEGTWKVNNLTKKVYIVETRDGIKARFSDELKWFVYTKGNDSIEFISENGHKYTLKRGDLVWTNADRSKTFSLSKVSDDMEE